MLAGLIKKYVALHAAKAIHTTTAAVGLKVQNMAFGIGFIAVGFISALLAIIVFLGAVFLYLAELPHGGSLLFIGIIMGAVAIIAASIGSLRLKG